VRIIDLNTGQDYRSEDYSVFTEGPAYGTETGKGDVILGGIEYFPDWKERSLCKVGEVFMYEGAITDTEEQALVSHMVGKWSPEPEPEPVPRTGWILLERSSTPYTGGDPTISANYGDEEVGNFSRLAEFDRNVGEFNSQNTQKGGHFLFRQIHRDKESDKTNKLKNNKPDEVYDEDFDGYWQWTQTSHPNYSDPGVVSGLDNVSYGGRMKDINYAARDQEGFDFNEEHTRPSIVYLGGLTRPKPDYGSTRMYRDSVRYVTDISNFHGGTQHSLNRNKFSGPGRRNSYMCELYIWAGNKPYPLPSGKQTSPKSPST
jgi:hypothetical protein